MIFGALAIFAISNNLVPCASQNLGVGGVELLVSFEYKFLMSNKI